MPEDFSLDEFNKDPKHQAARDKLDAMNRASMERIAAKRAEEEKKARDEKKQALGFPFNLFMGGE